MITCQVQATLRRALLVLTLSFSHAKMSKVGTIIIPFYNVETEAQSE